MGRKYHDISQRAVCVCLKASGNSSVAIAELTGVPAATVMSPWNRTPPVVTQD